MSSSTASGAAPDRRVHARWTAVGDAQRFAEAGGVVPIAVAVEQDRVRCYANRDAATRAEVRIGAKRRTLNRVINRADALGEK